MLHSPYDDDFSQRMAQPDGHRAIIGGLWDEMGRRQLDYLVANGLLASHRVLDIGCGSLRAGVVLVPYLRAGHYYGIDYLASLLECGYEREIRPLGLVRRLPRENLVEEREFRVPFPGVTFDVALAQSVFTHLPLTHLRLCLRRLRPRMRMGGSFYCTVFLAPDRLGADEPLRHPPCGEVETFSWRDPFHVWKRDIDHAALGLGWHLERVEEWGHPRGQQMACFRAA
jgi:SAM-dependent methyltransferase